MNWIQSATSHIFWHVCTLCLWRPIMTNQCNYQETEQCSWRMFARALALFVRPFVYMFYTFSSPRFCVHFCVCVWYALQILHTDMSRMKEQLNTVISLVHSNDKPHAVQPHLHNWMPSEVKKDQKNSKLIILTILNEPRVLNPQSTSLLRIYCLILCTHRRTMSSFNIFSHRSGDARSRQVFLQPRNIHQSVTVPVLFQEEKAVNVTNSRSQ